MKRLRKVFFVVLLLQLVNVFIWAGTKEGYYIDELWSYGLANSYYEPFLNEIEGHDNNWHEPAYYQSYLVVDEGEAFRYLSVYDNQVNDVHPPLFYILLHTICSAFPGVFSKWFGIGLNILFYVAAMWVLWKIGQQMFGEESISSMLPVLVYGFSLGVLNTVLYVRMYMMLVFFALLFVYLSLLWLKKQKGYALLIGLFVTTAAGFLTQYFFVIFIFFVAAALVLWQMIFRKIKEALQYSIAVGVGLAVAVGIFPASIMHVFHGDKGNEVLSQAKGALVQFAGKLMDYVRVVSSEVLGMRQLWWIVLAGLVIGLLITMIGLLRAWKEKDELSDCVPFGILVGAVAGYFVVVVKIAPEVTSRYQCLSYPFFILILCYLVVKASDYLRIKWLSWSVAALCILSFGIQYPEGMSYLYADTQRQLEAFAEKYSEVPGYYVTKEAYDHLVINDCLMLQQQKNTFVVDATDEETLLQLASQQPDEVIVYFCVYYVDKQLPEIMELWEYSSAKEVLATDFTKVMLLSR